VKRWGKSRKREETQRGRISGHTRSSGTYFTDNDVTKGGNIKKEPEKQGKKRGCQKSKTPMYRSDGGQRGYQRPKVLRRLTGGTLGGWGGDVEGLAVGREARARVGRGDERVVYPIKRRTHLETPMWNEDTRLSGRRDGERKRAA